MNRILLLAFAFAFSIIGLAAEEKTQELVIYKGQEVDRKIVTIIEQKPVVKKVLVQKIKLDQNAKDALVNLGAVITKILKEDHKQKLATKDFDIQLFNELIFLINALNENATMVDVDPVIEDKSKCLDTYFNAVVNNFISLLEILECSENNNEKEHEVREALRTLAKKIEETKGQIPLPKKIVVSVKQAEACLLLNKGYDLVLYLANKVSEKELLIGNRSNLPAKLIGFKDPSKQISLWNGLHQLVSFGNIKLVTPALEQCQLLRRAYKNKMAAKADTHPDKCLKIDVTYRDYCNALQSQRSNIVENCYWNESSSADRTQLIDVK